uniref:Tc1-like transposase DDE domain-containing protein n=1 Tax=Echeneis naucrates TaxID=173247 RepID=A0A665TUE7_ECHNA
MAMPCNIGWSRWMEKWMVGGWPPCPRTAMASTRKWHSHVLGRTEAVKMNSAKYIEFLTNHFLPWYKKKNCAFRSKIIFMRDNASSQSAKNTSVSMAAMGIKGEKLMVWPPLSPDLKPTENLWSVLKNGNKNCTTNYIYFFLN